jgi:hypothetical protein
MRFISFTVLALLSLGVQPAQAQRPGDPVIPQTIDEVRKDARMHLGPLYVTPRFDIKELGIDSNVFNEGGRPQSDFTATATPIAYAWVPVAHKALFRFRGGADLVWYQKFDSERSVNPQGAAGADIYVRRLTLTGGYSYLDSRVRPNYEIDIRSRRIERAATAGVSYALTPKVSVAVSGGRTTYDYDADAVIQGTKLYETLNRRSTGGSLTYRQKLTPLTAVVVRSEYFEDRFPYSPERDNDNVQVMPGLEFQPRALLKGSAFLGYRTFRAKNPELLPDYTGLVGDVSLEYVLYGATAVRGRYGRHLEYSYEPLQPYYIDNLFGLGVRRALGRSFDVVGTADRHRYAYQDLRAPIFGPSGQAPPRVDVIWVYEGSLGYLLGRTARLGFGAMYTQREAPDVRFHSYDGVRVRVTLTSGF